MSRSRPKYTPEQTAIMVRATVRGVSFRSRAEIVQIVKERDRVTLTDAELDAILATL